MTAPIEHLAHAETWFVLRGVLDHTELAELLKAEFTHLSPSESWDAATAVLAALLVQGRVVASDHGTWTYVLPPAPDWSP